MMTDYEFYKMTLEDKVRTEILEQNVIMNGNDLDKQVKDELERGDSFIIGPKTKLNAYGLEELPEAVDDGYIPVRKRKKHDETPQDDSFDESKNEEVTIS